VPRLCILDRIKQLFLPYRKLIIEVQWHQSSIVEEYFSIGFYLNNLKNIKFKRVKMTNNFILFKFLHIKYVFDKLPLQYQINPH